MKIRAGLCAVSVLALAGCGNDTTNSVEEAVNDATAATSEAVSDATAEVSETVAEVVDAVSEPELCTGFGPQTPRDITNIAGTNPIEFELAPASTELNLCNIHTHTQAEHKGPGFSIFAGDGVNGGYQCNETPDLTEAELTPVEGAFKGAQAGDTIEVHWVHTSCDIEPGKGLGSCVSDACTDPKLRVETQVFLVVNDPNALDFNDFAYEGNMVNGLHQPKAIPTGTGEPVVFRGSTTGPSYDQKTCSPFQVTWSVRPQCAKLDISSLHRWAEAGNVFEETESHGVRQLVTAPELLDDIR